MAIEDNKGTRRAGASHCDRNTSLYNMLVKMA